MKIIRILILMMIAVYFVMPAMEKNDDRQVASRRKMATGDKALKNFTGRGEWRVHGKVSDHQNNAVAGLTIELYDKDLIFDDLLGIATTNRYGTFAISYDDASFKELTEVKPDLYLKIKNKAAKVIYSSEKQVRFGAGKNELFNIVLPEKLFIKKTETIKNI